MELIVESAEHNNEEHGETKPTSSDRPPSVLADFDRGHDSSDLHHHQLPENPKQHKSQPGGHREEDAEGGPT